MKFSHAYIPGNFVWSSPFVRWQGSFGELSSMDLAASVTGTALAQRGFDAATATQLVLGSTIPQKGSFYGAPWIGARLGAEHITGPTIAQACATSVACVATAAMAVENDTSEIALVVTTDRTSNGPLLIYPRPNAIGGSPEAEHWVLDNFAADPWTGKSMTMTAEIVAAEAGFTREMLDDLTLLRYAQYQEALANDRAFQRRYMQSVALPSRKGDAREVNQDEGIHSYAREGLARLKPVGDGGVVTLGTQTHPADGTAGTVVCSKETALSLSRGNGVVRLIAVTYVRVGKAQMPKGATLAAQRALNEVGIGIHDISVVTTHNPFAVNDLWLSRETGLALDRMNMYGSSLIYGHPQAPTGLRAIAELIEALRIRGGGLGLFTGCAAGDSGAALLLSLE